MAKHLSNRDVQSIVNMIRGWPYPKITWSDICKEAQPLIGKLPSRQSLSAHEIIVDAYKTKKRLLKAEGTRKPQPASLKAASSRIENLEAEVAELKERNRKYKEMFSVWQYNAYKRGLTEKDLNQSLPKIDRERSDGERR